LGFENIRLGLVGKIMDIWHWLLLFLVLFGVRNDLINSFKIGYYEQKLKNRGCDISYVKNISLIEIIKLKT